MTADTGASPKETASGNVSAIMCSESIVAVPTWRLYLLRALYLLIAVGQGSMQWPKLIHIGLGWWSVRW